MINKQEKSILKLIQIVPAVLMTLFFIIILLIVVNGKIINNKQDIKDIKNNIIHTIKNKMKNELNILYQHINYKRETALENLKNELVQQVNIAYSIALNIYNNNKNRDKKIVVKMIKEALSPIRFNNGRGYIFIYSMDLKNILLPIAPELEGDDFSNYKDIKGDFVVKNMAALCKKHGETFYTWYWKKPNSNLKNFKKIGYVKYFKPFDWFIGTGEYIINFQKKLQQDILKEIRETRYAQDQKFFVLYDNAKDKFYTKLVRLAKQGGGFLQDGNALYCAVNIKTWKWTIVAKQNMRSIAVTLAKKQKEMEDRLYYTVLKLIFIFFVVAILLIIALSIIVKRSEKLFLRYRNSMINEAKESKKRLILIQNQNKMAALGEMLGNISHQWKQPLNALGISVSKLILLQNENILTKDILIKNLNRMEKNISYLSGTIDIFRDFFKPVTKVQEFNISEEIKRTVDMMESLFKESFIEISCDCKEDIYIKAEKKKLEQVLINILNNAKDALNQNNIEEKKICIEIVKKEDEVIIYILDNAGGVPEHIKDKIFEPYFTTKESKGGTGVGLYMSKLIIENHFQGKLEFINEDMGAKFIITIPIK